MSNKSVLQVQSLKTFFGEAIGSIVEENAIDVKSETTDYIRDMLVRFSKSEELYQKIASNVTGASPLASILAATNEVPAAKRPVLFQRIGDLALFKTGFFVYSFDNSMVSARYYKQMGANAYESVACETRSLHNFELFKDLSQKFNIFVDVLIEIRHQHEDALKLDELYFKTKSGWIAKKLRKMNVEVIPHKFN